MNKVSLNLNDRTRSIPIFSTINDLLDNYYLQFPIENDSKYGLLYDTYSLMQELFDIIGSKYDDETRLLLCNYVYRLKGSPKAIYELFRLLWGDNDNSIDGTPNYSVKYKYSVRGYNDIYRGEEKSATNLDRSTPSIDILATSKNPFILYYPTILPLNSKIQPWIQNEDIEGLISYNSVNYGEGEKIVEAISGDDKDSWINEDPNTTTKYNTIVTWTEYDVVDGYEVETMYTALFENSTTNKIEKTEKKYCEEPSGENIEWKQVDSEKTTSQYPDGTYYSIIKKTSEATVDENVYYKEETYINNELKDVVKFYSKNGPQNITPNGEDDDRFKLTTYTSNKDKYSFSIDTYEEIKVYSVTKERNWLLDKTRNPEEEEKENLVDFELYDDGSLKIKKTTQTAYKYVFKKTVTYVKSIFDNSELNSVTERVLEKTPMIIERTYSFKKPQKKLYVSGINLILNPVKNEFKNVNYNDIINFNTDETTIYEDEGEIKFEDLFSIIEDKKESLGDLYYTINPKISHEDTEESMEAQKNFWSSLYDSRDPNENVDIPKIKLKGKSVYDFTEINEKSLGITVNNSEYTIENNQLLKTFIRPHVEIRIKTQNSEGNTEGNSDGKYLDSKNITEIFSNNPIKYSDARELEVSISNVSVLNYNRFILVLQELIRDLLLVSRYNSKEKPPVSGGNNDYSKFDDDAILIKVDLINYYIDANINLSNFSKVRQINNIVPHQYITEGKLLWTSPYLQKS